jgi:hypothetical protein
MSTTFTASSQVLHRRAGKTIVHERVSRGRRNLAGTLEMTLEPRVAVRRGLRSWPRVPRANRAAVAEPLAEIVALLRDPAVAISADASRRILKLATHPTSPVYGQYPNRAGFAVWSLLAELRGHANPAAV